MKIKYFALFLMVTSPVLISPNAQAQEREGAFGDWTSYSRTENGNKICYAISEPQSKRPGTVNHGDVYFMIASWKSGAASEQPSLITGYTLKAERPPNAKVGNTRYPMYASANEAYIEDNRDERNLVAKMRSGSLMRVEAVSERGTNVSYEFSLKGITAALRNVKANCA